MIMSTNFKLEISGPFDPIPSIYLQPLTYSRANVNFAWDYYVSNMTESKTFNVKLVIELNGETVSPLDPRRSIDHITLNPLVFWQFARGFYKITADDVKNKREIINTAYLQNIDDENDRSIIAKQIIYYQPVLGGGNPGPDPGPIIIGKCHKSNQRDDDQIEKIVEIVEDSKEKEKEQRKDNLKLKFPIKWAKKISTSFIKESRLTLNQLI